MKRGLFWALAALFIVLFVASPWLMILNGSGSGSGIETMSQSISSLAIACAGFFILSRKYRNTIGWIFVVIALSMVFWSFADGYARYVLLTRAGNYPLGMVFAWFSLWSWAIYVWLIMVYLPLLYPNGRLLSPRWRAAAWYAGINMVVIAAAAAFTPGVMANLAPFANPLGIGRNPAFWQGLLSMATVAFIPAILLATLSLILRFRRSGAEQRAQIKWFLYVAVLFLLHATYGISSEMGLVPELPFGISPVIFSLLVTGFALATAVAVLKYRLYDIDLIIRKTLVYTAVTALLALVYFGSVVLLQSAFEAVSGQQSAVTIVLSTLLIAALFHPLRRRIQNVIDRRFFRQKYDAAQALAQFAQTARDEVEAAALEAELLRIVQATMQPAYASLWLKSETETSQ